jgi:hypothetical protein
MLLKMSGKQPLYPEGNGEHSGAVRADQFYGKGLTTSAAEYLMMRKQACQPDDIYRALKTGGFDFELQGWRGDDRDMVRNVAMSLSKNTGATGKFHRLKNGSFGLRDWYDPRFLQKAAEEGGTAKKKKAARSKAKGKKALSFSPTMNKQSASQKPPKTLLLKPGSKAVTDGSVADS